MRRSPALRLQSTNCSRHRHRIGSILPLAAGSSADDPIDRYAQSENEREEQYEKEQSKKTCLVELSVGARADCDDAAGDAGGGDEGSDNREG